MKRFFGMMPSSEVTLERTYKDNEGLRIRLQAGPHGWTVIYAVGGKINLDYTDIDALPEENLESAYQQALSHFSELTKVSEPKCYEVCKREC